MSLPTPLVSTQWLADHLGADDLLVVEASVLPFTQPNGRHGYLSGHETYLIDGHIPGAVFADLIEEFADPEGRFSFPKPDAARFASAAGALGIGPGTKIVLYDRGFGQWAARLWWLLRSFGWDDAAVLDGGWRRWTSEQRPTDIGHVEPTPASFEVHERPELWASKQEVEAVVRGDLDAVLVAAIGPREFSGEEGRGHIPGSINIPAGQLVDRATNTVLPVAELRERFDGLESRVISYCNGGIVSATEALALVLAGHPDVAIYDGSLSEWAADPDAPLVTSETAGSSQTKSVHA
jgi:thiosulfate/3-mercaptopyruvate sulfurtransferase